jgi:hypothetical protein
MEVSGSSSALRLFVGFSSESLSSSLESLPLDDPSLSASSSSSSSSEPPSEEAESSLVSYFQLVSSN